MKLHNVMLVARRDYIAYVGRRRFWISLLITPAIFLAFLVVPGLIAQFHGARQYAVVDHSGWLLQAVEQRIEGQDFAKLLDLAVQDAKVSSAKLPPIWTALAPQAAKLDAAARAALGQALAGGGSASTSPAAQAIWQQRDALRHWYAQLTPVAAAHIDRSLSVARYQRVGTPAASLQDATAQGKLDGYFTFPDKPLAADATYAYASRNLTDTDLRDWFAGEVSAVVQERRAAKAGLSPDQARWLGEGVTFQGQLVTEHGHKAVTSAEKVAQWLPVGYVYLLFIAIMQIAQLLMMATIEEKSNRIAEMLLAAIEPSDIMAGKTLGVAGVGITLVGSWLLIIIGLLATAGSAFALGSLASEVLSGITAWNIIWFLIYFVLGFLLYAAVMGAIGASVNNIREAQPYMTPVMLFLVLPLVLMVPAAQDPGALWVRVLSYVPPLTPFMMMSRSAAPPPLTDYVFTTALLLFTVLVVLYGAGRVFRRGLLNAGAPPRLREMFAWARHS
ncbi:MAG TPA: ABC transporter permease [Rhodanobacteraceae bacterium]|nr:ABC transporter permease [Rhodanobacteraceae bacterium]